MWDDTVGYLFFFLVQGAVVSFAWKTLFMKSTQLGGISKEWPASCGRSTCQWLATPRGTEWVSSRRWAGLATGGMPSTSSSGSSTRQVSSACCLHPEPHPSFPFLRRATLPLEMKGGAPLGLIVALQKWLQGRGIWSRVWVPWGISTCCWTPPWSLASWDIIRLSCLFSSLFCRGFVTTSGSTTCSFSPFMDITYMQRSICKFSWLLVPVKKKKYRDNDGDGLWAGPS